MKNQKKTKKIPKLKLPKTVRGFRGLYNRLCARFKKEQGAVASVTVHTIHKQNRQHPDKELHVLKIMCKFIWRQIHQPLDLKDAVPETVSTRL